MKTRLGPIFIVWVCLTATPVFGQNLTAYPVKFGKLDPDDKLRIEIIKTPVRGPAQYTERANFLIRIRADKKMDRIAFGPNGGDFIIGPLLGPPPMRDVEAGGLTVSELQEVLTRRWTESSFFETRVVIHYLGRVTRLAQYQLN